MPSVLDVVQQWVIPVAGLLLGGAGVYYSYTAANEATHARRAADAARDAAIRAQQELTVHRELLPEVEQLNGFIKPVLEGFMAGKVDDAVLNEVLDRLSRAGTKAEALQKEAVADLLNNARKDLGVLPLSRETILSAGHHVNGAVAKLKFDADSLRRLAQGSTNG